METDMLLYYWPERNPEGKALMGVPLRDLTRADLEALPEWLLPSIEACGFYDTQAPPADTEAPPAEEAEEEKR